MFARQTPVGGEQDIHHRTRTLFSAAHCACALPLLCFAVLRAFSKQTQIVGHMSGVMKFTLNVHTAPHSIRSTPQAVGLAAARSQTQFLM